jgi:hypothetical protein
MRIITGPDRLGLANALFDTDEHIDELRTVYFRFENRLGNLGGVSIHLDKLYRESGNQTKKWCIEGFVSQKAREKSGHALSGKVTGYYDLNDRKGWLRLERA